MGMSVGVVYSNFLKVDGFYTYIHVSALVSCGPECEILARARLTVPLVTVAPSIIIRGLLKWSSMQTEGQR